MCKSSLKQTKLKYFNNLIIVHEIIFTYMCIFNSKCSHISKLMPLKAINHSSCWPRIHYPVFKISTCGGFAVNINNMIVYTKV